MTEIALSYDHAFDQRYDQILDLIEYLERQDDPDGRCHGVQAETGLSDVDLRRILRWRRRWPQWRVDRVIPRFIVQKAMQLEGHYGPEAQAWRLANDFTRSAHS